MVDPISINSLLGTAAALSKTVLDYTLSVKDTPNEVKNLNRELANLHDLFDQLVIVVQVEGGRETFSEVSTLYKSAGVR